MSVRIVIALFFLLLPLSAARGQGLGNGKEYDVPAAAWEEAAIHVASAKLAAAVWRKDAATAAQLYTADGRILRAGADVAIGHAGIEAFWRSELEAGISEARLETDEVSIWLNDAQEVGRYTLRGSEGQLLDQGTYIVLWKRENGTWKRHRDIRSTSVHDCLSTRARCTRLIGFRSGS